MSNIFNEYPYRNFSDLNLDYILKKLSEMDSRIAEYVKQSTITFHDPITWVITEQYTVNTMVVDSDGTAYLSVKAVPAGIDITNTEYWQPIFNYDDSINKVRSSVAYNERDRETASAARSVGDLVYVKGTLYKVTVPMSVGALYIPGENCEEYTVYDRIKDVESKTTSQIQTIKTEVTGIDTKVNSIDTKFQTEVNSINTKIENDEVKINEVDGKTVLLNDSINIINERIETLKKRSVSLDIFSGNTDEEKLEAFLAQDIYKVVNIGNVTINRPLNLTNESTRDHRYHIINGGTINLKSNMFQITYAFLPMFNNVSFIGDNYIVAGTTEVGLMCIGCAFNGAGVVKMEDYAQSLYLTGCQFNHQTHYSIFSKKAYDMKINSCRFESAPVSGIYIAGGDQFAFEHLDISNSIFEGYHSSPAIEIGNGFGGAISKCYFEANNPSIKLQSYNAYMTIENNLFINEVGDYAVLCPAGFGLPLSFKGNVLNTKLLHGIRSDVSRNIANISYSNPTGSVTPNAPMWMPNGVQDIAISDNVATIKIRITSPYYVYSGHPIYVHMRGHHSSISTIYYGYLDIIVDPYIDNNGYAAVSLRNESKYPSTITVSAALSSTTATADGTDIILTVTGFVDKPEVYIRNDAILSFGNFTS